jgi:hypothetical protein
MKRLRVAGLSFALFAWIKRLGFGNTELDHRLYTARLGGSAHLLRRAQGYNNTDCGLGGPQIDGLVGSGAFLAVAMVS